MKTSVITGLALAAVAFVAAFVFKTTGGLSTGDYPNWPGVFALIAMCVCGLAALMLLLMPVVLAVCEYVCRRFERTDPDRE
jgi:hypothetical protein